MQSTIDLTTNYLTSNIEPENPTHGTTTSYSIRTCFSVSVDNQLASWIRSFQLYIFKCLRFYSYETSLYLTLPNRTSIPIHFTREVRLNPQLILQNVLYVTQFSLICYLFSALTMASQLTFSFFGNKLGDLYFLDVQRVTTESSNSNCTFHVSNVDAHIWHSWLGHLSDQRLARQIALFHI